MKFTPISSLVGFAVLATATVLPAPISRRALAGAPTASTNNGSYYGIHNAAYNQDFFLGIPFAQPPISDLRFANPAPLNVSWNGALPATDYAFVRTPR